MVFRITTWNVNGIRNPFGYHPWCEKRRYQDMFATLDADIIIMQECKIQKKDMTDDMVLVPGWDAYFSLPRHKKGYSGVAIYTKTATCTPIRAEEGISGVLCPPGSAISYRDLPKSQQIGGYPSRSQLLSGFDEATLDSEGRCMVLEFPAFVLFGIYSPASCDQDRAGFRLSFFHALDLRIRNLVALGKQVIVAGDLNVSRDIRDSCGIVSALAKADIKIEEYMNDDLRRIFNQQVFGGQVCGSRDAERQEPVLRDLCREFHPERPDMFTCWDTRRNTRPANNGSRIDYVLCSEGLWKWIVGADIQPGLMGSDHCPVYADMSDTLTEKGVTHNLLDLMNPEGVFSQGVRLKQWSTADCLAQSARLMPQFSGRVSIKSMFKRHQSHGRKTAMGPCKEGQVVVDALKESGITMSTCESPVDLQKGMTEGRCFAQPLETNSLASSPKADSRRAESQMSPPSPSALEPFESCSTLLPQRPITKNMPISVSSTAKRPAPAADPSSFSPSPATALFDSRKRRNISMGKKRGEAEGGRAGGKASASDHKQSKISGFFQAKAKGGSSSCPASNICKEIEPTTTIAPAAAKTTATKRTTDVTLANATSSAPAPIPPTLATNTSLGLCTPQFYPPSLEQGQNISAVEASVAVAKGAVQTEAAAISAASGGVTNAVSETMVVIQPTPTVRVGVSSHAATALDEERVYDPIEAKESWSGLLGNRRPPLCEHNEACVSLKTKKPGMNCGRSFFMCARPLGPSGDKESGTEWRCGTFIWSSEWNRSSSRL